MHSFKEKEGELNYTYKAKKQLPKCIVCSLYIKEKDGLAVFKDGTEKAWIHNECPLPEDYFISEMV
jgi:hypothetical protein